MATLGSTYLTLIDVLKRQEHGEQIATVIEMLKQSNAILDDAMALECNMGAAHRHTIRTGLPSVSWGMLYKGTPQSKSTTQQVDDTTGFVEAMSAVDTRLLDLSSNPGALRLSEATAFLESLNQEMATGMFYHDTATSPEKFKGLSARYSTIGGSGAGNQIIDAGGTGSDNTSVWFVTWGDNYTHLLYPKGTQAGVQRADKGEQRVTDADGNPFYVKEEKFTWHIGMAVRDWRYNARIANVDVSDLRAGSVDLYKFMRKAYYKLQSRRVPAGRQAIYCNREILEALDGLANADTKVMLSRQEVEGKEVLTYRGIPLRETDALLNTEGRVT
ncbi:major capsid protein [Azospirillum doebereinerae]|uniref:major capsid protein n=1 Tax=Azospirillum doebereinerae TaxID=92933 RepID=UPI001EE5E9F5|nr:hypothetical protein [Azospirillum doebereinerae]MCG5241393.1 hypothetical protein [Azospirillum doebereinerae]